MMIFISPPLLDRDNGPSREYNAYGPGSDDRGKITWFLLSISSVTSLPNKSPRLGRSICLCLRRISFPFSYPVTCSEYRSTKPSYPKTLCLQTSFQIERWDVGSDLTCVLPLEDKVASKLENHVSPFRNSSWPGKLSLRSSGERLVMTFHVCFSSNQDAGADALLRVYKSRFGRCYRQRRMENNLQDSAGPLLI